jgi:hypothetical protein
MKVNELLNAVGGILGKSETEVMSLTYIQTIEKLVEVIENDRANK